MGLIDADEVLKYIPSEEPLSRWAIKNAPTVDAIPVEWIKGWIDNISSNPRYKVIGEIRNIFPTKDVAIVVPCVSDMLKDWKEGYEPD